MRIAVFVENRNGVGLASRIMRAEGAGAHSFHLVTADRQGTVAGWIEQEAASRLDGVAVRNLFTLDEALSEDEFFEELGYRLRAFAEREHIDRLVFFNDQSSRGRRVAGALGRTVPLVLVQDGHLDFHFKKTGAGLKDQNRYYGSSPSLAAVCVWGPATAQQVMFRSVDADPPVHITGALGHSDDPALMRAARSTTHRHAGEAGEPLRIVVLDQPLGDQRKLSRKDHREQLTGLCAALSEFGRVEINPHPSSFEGHLAWLRTLPDVTVLDEKALLDAEALDGYDLAVTFFSTTYLQTLRAGTPLILFSPPPLDIVFPTVNHALLRNVGTVGELVDVVADLQRSGKFVANVHGEPVEHFLTFADDVAGHILRVVAHAAVPAEPTAVRRAPAPLPRTGLSRAEEALRAVRRQSELPRSMAVLGLGFSYVTGVAIPILTYTQSLLAQSPVDVRYFDLAAYSRAEDVMADLADVEVVLVNSLAPFWRSPLANELVQALQEAGRSVVLYAHETEYVMNFEAVEHALRHQEMLRLLPRMKVLCVSAGQADMFRQLGVAGPVLVYNTVPRDTHHVRARAVPGERPRIVMVGSMQDRKGLDLFSRVAELAYSQGLPWRFAWIGHKTPRIGPATLLSDRVEWMGALSRNRVREELAASDVFFLSSVDDPMPLSVVEAVQQRLRTVTYHRVGSREVLEGVSGYRSFAEYSPASALDALRGVLDEEISEADYQEVEELFDIPAFTARMTTALGLPVAGEAEVTEQEPRERFSAVLSRHGRYLTDDFVRHLRAGRHDDALRVGTEILRRRHPVDVVIGMAEIHARRGDAANACRLLSAAAIAGGDRSKVWAEVARVAGLLDARGRSIRQLARREMLRIQVSNRSARILKSD